MIGSPANPAPRRRPPVWWLTMIAMALVLVEGSGVAQAQLTKALREAAAREAAEVAQAAQLAGGDYDIDESVFNHWIFGPAKKGVSQRDHLDSLLMLAIADLDRACTLTDAQRRKLILAGHGDRKRFGDRVAEARRVYEEYRHDPNGAEVITKVTQPLAADYEWGLYGEGSFFAKSLATTLTPEQQGRRRAAIEEKLKFRYRAKVSLILASLDARVGFTAEQYRQFIALIMDETRPPKKAGVPNEEALVLLKIARLPEAKVRPIFGESQWKRLDQVLRVARAQADTLEIDRLRAEGQLD